MSVLQLASAVLLALAALLGAARVWLRRVRAAPEARGRIARAFALMALQAAAAAALYCVLYPPGARPATEGAAGALVIATAGAPATVALAPGERLLALPEARAAAGVARAPDLAAALRRHPQARAVRVVGHGLRRRDREQLEAVARTAPVRLSFTPGPPPQGLVGVSLPGATPPGMRFAVHGALGVLPAGVVELADPAGRVVATAKVRAQEDFHLEGVAPAQGLSLFELRLRDGTGRVVERLDAPIDATPRLKPRLLALAGAPGAELKFLRRWAEGAGVDMTLDIDLGGGARLGPALRLDKAALRGIDLAVIDDRRWEAAEPATRAVLLQAAREGMGLLLRLAAPPSPDLRRSWAELGFGLGELAQRAPASLAGAGEPGGLPAPTLVAALAEAPGTLLLPGGAATWRAYGQGRIGVLASPDTYVWRQSGRGDRHAQLWGGLISTLARAEVAGGVRIEGLARAGERTALCGLLDVAAIAEPDGAETVLVPDPAAGPEGCAGYWPAAPGWRIVRTEGRETAFYIHPADAAPSLAAAEAARATQALVSSGAGSGAVVARPPGSPWPWFCLLLVLLAALWALERWRAGGQDAAQPR